MSENLAFHRSFVHERSSSSSIFFLGAANMATTHVSQSEPLNHHIPALQRLDTTADHGFFTPKKCINDGNDLDFFLSSKAYKDLSIWLYALNRSMFPTKDASGNVTSYGLTKPPVASAIVQSARRILDSLSEQIEKAPPSTGPRRFGNVAFRDWSSLAGDMAGSLISTHLSAVVQQYSGDARAALIDELREYLTGSFGSAQRLDYGTGHELSFMAFLACLWKLGAFEPGEERAIVICLIQPYLELMRKLIMTYTLEPAGSHGVWGLDDHSFIPYIFGSAQFGPAIDTQKPTALVPTEGTLPSAPSPSSVAKKDIVADYKDSNMYFSAIHFIYDVKRGPFWEHSPVLYDVSGIKDGWGKINKGMLKMYAAEVLGKFPVVQHFPFGSFFKWEQDPDAVMQSSSVHAQHQPPISKDTARPPGTLSGTPATWNTSTPANSALPAMQSSTGVPTARTSRTTAGEALNSAPSQHDRMSATAPRTGAARPPAVMMPGANSPTPAPWAIPQTTAPSGPSLTPTAAPWANRKPNR
nr:serine/threonine-protein phosphatase 2a activator 1 [Quercus suber]